MQRSFTFALLLVVLLIMIGPLAAQDAVEPVSLSTNLDYYADSGHSVQFCETGWVMGHSGAITPHCTFLTNPHLLFGHGELLDEGEYLSIALSDEALEIDDLIARWGMPHLAHDAQDHLTLVWDLPAIQATATLTWLDPHRIPLQAILTLKSA